MKQYIEGLRKYFESILLAKLGYITNAVSPIGQATWYAITSGGKRLRPILCYLGAELMDAQRRRVDNIALAIECVHNYSLTHDDLPAMDNDTLRHGKPTVHVAFGEGMAVLVGDALLNLASEILLLENDIDSNYINAMRIFHRNAGISGMIAGQCVDIASEGKIVDIDTIINLNKLKTSCLFRASLVTSCVACGANSAEQEALEKYCDILGIIFQIVDDILDVESSETVLGKNIGSDISSNKSTYLNAVGIDRARADIDDYQNMAIECLSIFGHRADRLIEFTKYLTARKK